jgi:hypothetical protein
MSTQRAITAALTLALLTLSGALHAAEEESAPVDAWGILGPSPYYVPHGMQSPIRDDGLHVGGDVWIDTGYEQRARGLNSEPDHELWLMQGRFMVDLTATHTWRRFFAQAKAQILAHMDEIPGSEHIDTDDAYIRFGIWDLFDFQLGRFEGWEVYHKGEGLERDTLEDQGAFDGPDIYEVNYAFYRESGFGQAALHAYPFDWLRFELGSVFGNELGFNTVGLRPVAIVDLGVFRLKLSGEYRKLENQEEGKKQWEKKRGAGGGFQVALEDLQPNLSLHFGGNAAYGVVDRVDPFGKVDERGSPDTLSVGGYLNVGLYSAVLGLGYNHTIEGDRQRNDQTEREGRFVHQQAFGSIRHPIVFPWLTAKLVAAWARADLEPAFDNARENDMFSVRLRLFMQF